MEVRSKTVHKLRPRSQTQFDCPPLCACARVGFTYLILALFGGSGYLVGGTRICFNGALLICSPMAGGIAERTNIKKLLNKTVLFRGIIYVLAIPLAWVLMDSGLLWAEHTPLHIAFFVVFLLLIFLDGIGVSFSNVADIDSGGVNLVAAQYGLEIDDNVRNYFNSLHIMFFDLSMVVFNPLLAYLGLLVSVHSPRPAASRHACLCVCVVVCCGCVLTHVCLCCCCCCSRWASTP